MAMPDIIGKMKLPNKRFHTGKFESIILKAKDEAASNCNGIKNKLLPTSSQRFFFSENQTEIAVSERITSVNREKNQPSRLNKYASL